MNSSVLNEILGQVTGSNPQLRRAVLASVHRLAKTMEADDAVSIVALAVLEAAADGGCPLRAVWRHTRAAQRADQARPLPAGSWSDDAPGPQERSPVAGRRTLWAATLPGVADVDAALNAEWMVRSAPEQVRPRLVAVAAGVTRQVRGVRAWPKWRAEFAERAAAA